MICANAVGRLSAASVALAVHHGKRKAEEFLANREIVDLAIARDLYTQLVFDPGETEYGSGVLIQVGDLWEVATATHVVSTADRTFSKYVIERRIDKKPYLGAPFSSEPWVFKHDSASKSGEQDRDTAVLWSPRMSVEELRRAGYRALPLEKVSETLPSVGDKVAAVHFSVDTRDSTTVNSRHVASGGVPLTHPKRVEPSHFTRPEIARGRIVRGCQHAERFGSVADFKLGAGASGAPVMRMRDRKLVGLVAAGISCWKCDFSGTLLTHPGHLLDLLGS
jgi:hypothetical protein